MKEIWIVNASPLITLAKIGQLDLLRAPGRETLIPGAVAEEILEGPAGDPASIALETGAITTTGSTVVRREVVEWGLGAGETSVLSLAIERDATAVIDDREARIAARTLGVRFIGTLGVVLRSRLENRIQAAAPVIVDLKKAGLRLDDALIRSALRRFCGEEWEP